MVDKQKNISVVHDFWNVVSAKDIEGYLDLFTDEAVAYDPVNKPPQRTREQRRANMQGVFDSFGKIEAKVDFVTTCGNRTVNKWTVVGTTPGGEVTIEGVDVMKHDISGKIDEMWGYFDN